MELIKGSIVFGKAVTYSASPGLKGVCHNVGEVNGRPAYGVIFENGIYDSFSPVEVDLHLSPADRICPSVTTYQFTTAAKLSQDFNEGRFDDAFKTGPNGKPPRPSLKLV